MEYFGGVEDKETLHNQKPVTASDSQKTFTQNVMKRRHMEVPMVSTEIFNKKEEGSIPTNISFQYNPYTVESLISIDGNEVEPPNKLYDLKNERIQVWLQQLLPILTELCNDSSFCIDFYGLRPDYDDLFETVRDFCAENSDVEVQLKFSQARGDRS